MCQDKLFKEVRAIFAEVLGVDEELIHHDTNIQHDLDADSLDTVELIMALEEAFEVSIPDEAAEDIVTVGDAIKCIKKFKVIKDQNLKKIRKNKNYYNEQQSKDMQETIEVNVNEKDFDLNERIEEIEKEFEILKSQYMQIVEDFDNYRNQVSRDKDDFKVEVIRKLLNEILPLVDNFERARQQLNPESEEAQTLHISYQGLYKQLVEILKQQRVTPMEVVGEKFDPNLHEAVLTEPNDEYEEDIIIEELQRGYYVDGKVLRYALVKVSKGL